ncbi:hypothetical protein Cgig2_019182 [Carnegiea gigantea]|uniref:Uncharacterized protein n=1 Tax=Carnegiea gigantea TaxID=171969 RepID=A0A9Q1Q906_9CARY|nr:hypothetical protein Cgig2_019182 [Carnegiea gigantea]
MYNGAEIQLHVADVDMMNMEQEGSVGLGNAEHEMSKKRKIRCKKIKEFNNWMLPKGLRQLIENLNDNVPKCVELTEMMQSQVDGGKDSRRNFVTFMLCYLDRVVFRLTSVSCQFTMFKGWTNDERKSRDNTTVIDEEEEVNQEECHNKSIEAEAKVEDQTGVSKVKVATDLIITNSQLLADVMIELEELLPGARTRLKRVKKVVAESTSDALSRNTTKTSKSRILVLSQD